MINNGLTKVWSSGSGLARTNTVVMSNKELVWDNPDTHSAMLDRSPCGSGQTQDLNSFEAQAKDIIKTKSVQS